jgi:hypothetical protein
MLHYTSLSLLFYQFYNSSTSDAVTTRSYFPTARDWYVDISKHQPFVWSDPNIAQTVDEVGWYAQAVRNEWKSSSQTDKWNTTLGFVGDTRESMRIGEGEGERTNFS